MLRADTSAMSIVSLPKVTVGERVVLQGLVQNTDLNNEIGTIEQVQEERAIVRMDSGRLVSAKKVCLHCSVVIQPMEWGEASPTAFFNLWKREIAMRDSEFFHRSGSAVYSYLIAKAFSIANTVKAPGQAGWAFRNATPSDVMRCVVWADGTKDQTTPLGVARADERWWPCIILRVDEEVVPFYCPALCWANARPWTVHITRVRVVACANCAF